VIRVARPGDGKRLSLVGRASFLETYADLLPVEDVLAHTEKQHAPDVYCAWLADAKYRTWLVETGPGSVPVGYLVLSPPDLPMADLTPQDLEIKRIYVLHKYQRKGVGRELMERATQYAREAGYRRLLLGVYSRNTAALAFYDRIGFRPVGERYFRVGAHEYFDHILGIDLDHG
jgi:diamine N-acetyltransferase